MIVEWLETFELGVPEIDGDHRVMVSFMKAIESAIASGRTSKECAVLIDRLLAFTTDHFRREERLLKSWGYAETRTHAVYHKDLSENAGRIKKICLQQVSAPSFKECCDELMNFLVDDVVRGDMRLKSFLQEAGMVLRP